MSQSLDGGEKEKGGEKKKGEALELVREYAKFPETQPRQSSQRKFFRSPGNLSRLKGRKGRKEKKPSLAS